jgi:hypothetical protein
LKSQVRIREEAQIWGVRDLRYFLQSLLKQEDFTFNMVGMAPAALDAFIIKKKDADIYVREGFIKTMNYLVNERKLPNELKKSLNGLRDRMTKCIVGIIVHGELPLKA